MRRRKRRLGRGWRRLAMHFIPLELENIKMYDMYHTFNIYHMLFFLKVKVDKSNTQL